MSHIDKFHEVVAAARAVKGGDKRAFNYLMSKQEDGMDLVYPALFVINALVTELEKHSPADEDAIWAELVTAIDRQTTE